MTGAVSQTDPTHLSFGCREAHIVQTSMAFGPPFSFGFTGSMLDLLKINQHLCRLSPVSLTWKQYGLWLLWSLVTSLGPRNVVLLAMLGIKVRGKHDEGCKHTSDGGWLVGGL